MNKTENRGKKIVSNVFFSRGVPIVLFVMLQLFFWIAFSISFSIYFERYYFISAALAICLIVYILNGDEKNEFKIAWIIMIALLPVFGILTYLYTTMNPNTIRLKKRYDKHHGITASRLSAIQQPKALSGEKRDINHLSTYLMETGGYPTYTMKGAVYYDNGAALLNAITEELKSAKEYIFLQFFSVALGEVWDRIYEVLKEKVRGGVEVRLLYDGTNTLTNVDRNFAKNLSLEGIKTRVFLPVFPLFSPDQDYRNHRKIVIVDGKVAYTGGANIGDEYANIKERFGKWKDAGIRIEGKAVTTFTAMFLESYSLAAKDAGIDDYDRYLFNTGKAKGSVTEITAVPSEGVSEDSVSDMQEDMTESSVSLPVQTADPAPGKKEAKKKKEGKSGGYVIPYGDDAMNCEDIAEDVYRYMIISAKRYVYIMTPYLVIDNGMVESLCFAARSGVDVRIIMPHIPDKKLTFCIGHTYFRRLLKSGVKIYKYTPGFIHSKVVLSDDRRAITGTINFDYRSFYHHFEDAVLIYDNPVIKDIKKDFANTFDESDQVTYEDYERMSAFYKGAGKLLRLLESLV
ncbi:MAG: PLDc N-terminal domain-containing protein [Lachnospiraceae bacterium]|nr:PLDc N-terminal domain-containing protein [Lachnospiraceae bacterium]